jgi:hypothetical protein
MPGEGLGAAMQSVGGQGLAGIRGLDGSEMRGRRICVEEFEMVAVRMRS